jgi:glycosyltransferase involved in cell wall biosynthesis
MPRIIFLNHYFYPDHSATSQILSDLAFQLAEAGFDVHVITSQQMYDDPAVRLAANERLRGIEIHRVASSRFGRGNLIGRSLDYLSFYVSLWHRLIPLAQRGDIVVAKTDPPLLSVLAYAAARRRSAHLVNWLQDLYPEIAIALGVPLLGGPVGDVLAALRNRSLRRADANVALGKSMAARLRTCGVDAKLVHVIPNWADDEAIVPITAEENPLRQQWGLRDNFVVGYSGNLGRAHEFATVLAAAENLRNDPHIVFTISGGGTKFGALEESVRARGLERSFRFFPYQARATLKYSLGVPDVHWLSLPPRFDGLIFPSKLYGIAAAGRPLIAITGKGSEIAELIEQHECGCTVEPGDAQGLARLLAQLAGEPERCADMGRNARRMLDEQFSRRQAFGRWEQLLRAIAP